MGTNLRSVRVELLEGPDQVRDVVTVALSGSTGSGVTEVSVRGRGDRVRITVTDANETRTAVKSLSDQPIVEDPTEPENPSNPTDPVITTLTATKSVQGPWVRADVTWRVTGTNLAQVKVELLNGSSVVDSATVQVSGGEASGQTGLRTRTAATGVRLTVTDGAGKTATETRSF